MYHYIRPIKESKFFRLKGLELSSFKKQLDYLSNKFNFITAEQLIASSLGNGNLPKKPCYLTFDDGFKDHVKYVLPELLVRNIQGSFFPPSHAIENRKLLDVHAIHFILASTKSIEKIFIDLNNKCLDLGLTKSQLEFFFKNHAIPVRYTNGNFDSAKTIYIKRMLQFVLSEKIRSIIISFLFEKYLGQNTNKFAQELYMTLSDIKKLIMNGMYVGSHGCKHIWLSNVEKLDQIKDINMSINFLKKVGVKTNNWIMSYPYGSYNHDTLKILKTRGCLIALTTKNGIANLKSTNLLELSRYDTNDFPQ